MHHSTSETLSSVGIDVGTTTTQVIVSDLEILAPTYDGAAKVDVLDRRVRYRSPIHETPFADDRSIDAAALVDLIDEEVRNANLTASEIETGAVIATGEAARKENAEPLVTRLAERTGEFVVATAGASLEAVLAGYGAGGAERSRVAGSTVVTVDIGGGTTNVAVFEGGEVRQTRCIDVGGRLVRLDDAGTARSVSEPVGELSRAVAVGTRRSESAWRALAGEMADLVFDCLEGPPFEGTTTALAITDLPETPVEIDEVTFTGGVGRLVSDPALDERDPFEYGDLGVLLAAAIRDHERFGALPVRQSADEDIRATVVGAGAHTTTFTGRTISPSPELLPSRNLPVIALEGIVDADTADAVRVRTERAVRRARNRRDVSGSFALYAPDVGVLTYDRLQAIARGIAAAHASCSDGSQPLILLTRQNCAKVLGQLLESTVEDGPVMVLDELAVSDREYVDLGTPVAGGTAVPATIKTLVFDE